MLLYPQVGQHLREMYSIQGHSITIATVNLAQPWPAISKDLIQLLEPV